MSFFSLRKAFLTRGSQQAHIADSLIGLFRSVQLQSGSYWSSIDEGLTDGLATTRPEPAS
jgi:hypothetical protein